MCVGLGWCWFIIWCGCWSCCCCPCCISAVASVSFGEWVTTICDLLTYTNTHIHIYTYRTKWIQSYLLYSVLYGFWFRLVSLLFRSSLHHDKPSDAQWDEKSFSKFWSDVTFTLLSCKVSEWVVGGGLIFGSMNSPVNVAFVLCMPQCSLKFNSGCMYECVYILFTFRWWIG